MRRFAPIVVVVILGQVLAACSGRGLGPGEARLTVSGRAQVAGPGRGWQDAHSGRTLHRGERLQVDFEISEMIDEVDEVANRSANFLWEDNFWRAFPITQIQLQSLRAH